MIKALEISITTPSSYVFLLRYFKINGQEPKVFSLSHYLIELALIDYKMLKHKPSMIAAAALFLSMKVFKKPNPWIPALAKQSGFSEDQIRPCAKDLCVRLQNANKDDSALRKKFSLSKHHEVANIKLVTS